MIYRLRARFGVSCPLVFVLLSVLPLFPYYAQAQKVDEAQLRAAVIVGILRYTQWDQPIDGEIDVCVHGSEGPVPHLRKISSQPLVQGKVLHVVNLDQHTGVRQSCEVILVGEKNGVSLEQIEAADHSLVICDDCDEAESYSTIKINKTKDRIVFEVNLNQAKKNKLVFSSSLLELASRVEGKLK